MNIFTKMGGIHIGMRNIKTGLSVLICLMLYHLAGREGCLIATVSAIICMQDNVEKSLINGRNRLYGTVIGAIQGMAFLYVDYYVANAYLKLVLTAIGVMLLILFCNLLRRNDTIVIACMVFLAIMLGSSTQSPFVYSANRLLDTFIGVAIAVVINRLIRNPATNTENGRQPMEEDDNERDIR